MTFDVLFIIFQNYLFGEYLSKRDTYHVKLLFKRFIRIGPIFPTKFLVPMRINPVLNPFAGVSLQ